VPGRTYATSHGTRQLKKSPGRLCRRVDLRDACLAEPQGTWPGAVRCEVRAVSRSGCEAYWPRPAAAGVEAAAVTWVARVQAVAAATRDRSGRRRLARPRQAEGVAVGRAQARRWMRQAGVAVPRPTRRGPVTTDSRQGSGVAPHRLARPCDVEPPDHVWAGDITAVWTGEGGWSGSELLDV